MHFFNARRLADELRSGELSEAAKLRYLLASLVLAGLVTRPGLLGGITDPEALPRAALLLAMTLAGVAWCFRANQRGDGRSFVERFFCLSLPLGVWWTVLYYPLWVMLFAGPIVVGGKEIVALGSWSPGLVYSAVMLVLYYLAMARYVAIAAGAAPARAAPLRETPAP